VPKSDYAKHGLVKTIPKENGVAKGGATGGAKDKNKEDKKEEKKEIKKVPGKENVDSENK
jgi:hypothetical protein